MSTAQIGPITAEIVPPKPEAAYRLFTRSQRVFDSDEHALAKAGFWIGTLCPAIDGLPRLAAYGDDWRAFGAAVVDFLVGERGCTFAHLFEGSNAAFVPLARMFGIPVEDVEKAADFSEARAGAS